MFWGFVSKIDIIGQVTEEVNASKIKFMQQDIAKSYGIDADEVTMDVDYVATGTLTVVIPNGKTENQVKDELTKAIR